jgi:hypothetical protein
LSYQTSSIRLSNTAMASKGGDAELNSGDSAIVGNNGSSYRPKGQTQGWSPRYNEGRQALADGGGIFSRHLA